MINSRQLDLLDLVDLTLVPLKEHELIKLINEESIAFTTSRQNLGQYVECERKVSAYTLFYLPTNMPKFYFLIDRVIKLHGQRILKELSDHTFVDVGCGPGTFSLALLFYYKEKQLPLPKIHLIDQSKLMLKQAEIILKHFFPEVILSIGSNDISLSKDVAYTLFFGHSLNEFSADVTKRYLDLIASNDQIRNVIWIEPGTPFFFQKQLVLREQLTANKFSILYPCPNNYSCPIKVSQNFTNPEWCHQVLRLKHSADIERIAQLVSLDRKILPMCAMFFSRLDVQKSNWLYPYKFLKETKHSFDYEFCGEFKMGELGHIKGEIVKKYLSKDAMKNLKNRSLGYPLKTSELQLEIKKQFIRPIGENLINEYAEEL